MTFHIHHTQFCQLSFRHVSWLPGFLSGPWDIGKRTNHVGDSVALASAGHMAIIVLYTDTTGGEDIYFLKVCIIIVCLWYICGCISWLSELSLDSYELIPRLKLKSPGFRQGLLLLLLSRLTAPQCYFYSWDHSIWWIYSNGTIYVNFSRKKSPFCACSSSHSLFKETE